MSGIRVELYDTNASTRLAVLEQAADVQWLDVLSRTGSCQFSLPTDDSKLSQLTDYRFVRFSHPDTGLYFGHRLSPEQTWRHSDSRGRVVFSGPGLGALVDDAVLFPEYYVSGQPIDRYTEDARAFGPFSKSGTWMTGDAGWVAPSTQTYSSDTGRRAGLPRVFKKLAPSVDWISKAATPYTDVADGSVFWARKTVTVSAAGDYVWVYTGDNYVDMWVDGRLVGMSDDQLYGWKKAKRVELRLAAGDHVFCARVENAVTTSGANPYAFIGVLATVDANGKPDQVVAKTNSSWNVHAGSPEPGWYPGQVLYRFFTEAAARSVKGYGTMSAGFTASADSASVAWSGNRVTFERPLGTPGSEVAAGLSELGLDWHVDWAAGSAPVLNAWARRGQARTSGAGAVRLFLPQGLTDYETTRRFARKTALLAQRANGRWVQRTLDAGAVGRMETSGAVSAAGSEGTLSDLVDALLRRTSAPETSATINGSVLVGPQPGSAYDPLGDTILVPAHKGVGHMAARSLGVSVAQDGDSVRVFPLLAGDDS